MDLPRPTSERPTNTMEPADPSVRRLMAGRWEGDSNTAKTPLSSKWFAAILVAAGLTYVNPFFSISDSQPWALIVAAVAVVVGLGRAPFPMPILPIMATAFFAFAVFLLGDVDTEGARGLVGYASLALISWGTYYAAFSASKTALSIIIYVWTTVCVVQTFVVSTFAYGLMPRVGASEHRGALGLAVEPSYLAITATFLILLVWYAKARGQISLGKAGALIALCAAMLAMSLSGTAFLSVGTLAVGAFFAFRSALTRLAFALLSISAGGLLYLSISSGAGGDIRAFALLRNLINFNSPNAVLDASFAARLRDITVSVMAFIESGGLPHGFHSWPAVSYRIVSENYIRFSEYNFDVRLDGQSRIMSGWGSALFELGWGSVPLLIGVVFISIRACASGRDTHLRGWSIAASLVLAILVTTSTPLAAPFVGITIGLLMQVPALGGRARQATTSVDSGFAESGVGQFAIWHGRRQPGRKFPKEYKWSSAL